MVSIKTMNLSQTAPAKRLTLAGCFYSSLISGEHPFCKTLLLLIQVIFLALIPFIANASPPGSGSPPMPLVGVEPVIVQDINPPADYVGHVEAIQTVELRARVEGFLEQINFQEK